VAKAAQLSSEQLRRSVSETLKRVAYGKESFIITLHGKPAAKIVPLDDEEAGEKPRKPKP
jgi:prevent-host-death family protein